MHHHQKYQVVQIIMLLMAVSIVSAIDDDKGSIASRTEESDVTRTRSPRISSEFGYRLQNADTPSSQFRHEQRDTDGNVRGSYGFENPNGRFRFVHYVADDKGFRAHISSNEPGVGRQNPASVRINRFEHHSVQFDPKPTLQPPTSGLKRQSSDQTKQQARPHPSRYDFYSPIPPDKTKDYEMSILHDYGPYRSISSETNKQSFHRNPVEEFIRAKLDIPEGLPSESHNGERGVPQRRWESNPVSLPSLYQSWAENLALQRQREQTERISNSGYVSDNVLPNHQATNYLRTNAHEHYYPESYAPLFTDLQTRLKHKVHASLPDCNSASSALLCKPPSLESEISGTQNSKSTSDQSEADALISKTTNSDFKTGFNNELTSKILYTSYRDRENTLNFELENQGREEHQECNKNHFSSRNKLHNDYSTSLSHRLFGEQTIAMPSNDNKGHFVPDLYEKQPQNSRRVDDIEYSQSLVHFLRNEQNLDTLKRLLMKTSDTPTDSTRPKLTLLGILILPASILNELSYSGANNPTDTKPETSDDRSTPSSILGFDVPGSGAAEQSGSVFDEGVAIEVINRTEMKSKDYLPSTNTSRNETDGDTPLSSTYPHRNNGPSTSNQATDKTEDSVNNSGFLIFDDPKPDKSVSSPNLTADNWRKMLEEEMKRDYERTSSQHSEDITGLSPNQRQYPLDENVHPLYDSTGRPVKRENVPIHIHRLNLPSGMTSLPWKFTIPRPGPPRGIVIPPKPPVLS